MGLREVKNKWVNKTKHSAKLGTTWLLWWSGAVQRSWFLQSRKCKNRQNHSQVPSKDAQTQLLTNYDGRWSELCCAGTSSCSHSQSPLPHKVTAKGRSFQGIACRNCAAFQITPCPTQLFPVLSAPTQHWDLQPSDTEVSPHHFELRSFYSWLSHIFPEF